MKNIGIKLVKSVRLLFVLIKSKLKIVKVEQEKDAGIQPDTIPSGYGNDMTLREEEILKILKKEVSNFYRVDKMIINNLTFWRARIKKEDDSVWCVLYSGSLKKFSGEYRTIYTNVDSTGMKIVANQGDTSDEIFFNIKIEDGVTNWTEEKYERKYFVGKG